MLSLHYYPLESLSNDPFSVYFPGILKFLYSQSRLKEKQTHSIKDAPVLSSGHEMLFRVLMFGFMPNLTQCVGFFPKKFDPILM